MKKPRFYSEFSSPFLTLLLGLSVGCSGDPAEENTPEPPSNPWNGQTFLLDVTARDWSEPRGIGREIDGYVPNFLITVNGDSPDTFDVVMGTADAAGTQDNCNVTSEHVGTAAPPTSAIGPTEFPLHIQHINEPDVAVDGMIYDLTMTNVLPQNGMRSTEGELAATMDFREYYRLFTLLGEPTPEVVCEDLEATYLTPCSACPNDGEPFCLTLKAVYIGAVPTDSVIEPIDALDPSCTPEPVPEP